MLLHDVLTSAARRAPDTPAVITEAETVTFAELAARVDRRAAQIAAMSDPGDRVAVLAENRSEYVELYYAVPLAGRVLLPLNHRLHAQEWLAALGAAEASMLYGEGLLLDRYREAVESTDLVRHVLAFDGRSDPTRNTFAAPVLDALGTLDSRDAETAKEVSERTHPASAFENAAPFLPQPRTSADIAWLIGTSGTTGSPKLAMLSDANLLAAVDATLPARPVGEGDVLLTPFPLCHVAGYNVFVLHRRARPIVLQRSFDSVGLTRLVKEHGVTMLSLAPTMIAMLLDHPEVDDRDLASVRALGYGASPIPGPILRRVVDRWGWDCSQGFGMTELGGNALFLGPDEHRRAAAGDERLLSAAGTPAPGVEVRLGTDDELLVRAPQVMRGYWNDPVASSAAIVDGWLHTGDVARIDTDGMVSIVDRKKDVIVSGGENVASREVEEVLHAHPGVADVAVIGVPDTRWGERVCAVVVARDVVDAAVLIEHCRTQLAGFKRPRQIEFVDSLPRNGSGKVLKHQLRETFGTPTGPTGASG
ncbi:MAG: AMP-binding protein [Acidimicrobiia bacterium]